MKSTQLYPQYFLRGGQVRAVPGEGALKIHGSTDHGEAAGRHTELEGEFVPTEDGYVCRLTVLDADADKSLQLQTAPHDGLVISNGAPDASSKALTIPLHGKDHPCHSGPILHSGDGVDRIDVEIRSRGRKLDHEVRVHSGAGELVYHIAGGNLQLQSDSPPQNPLPVARGRVDLPDLSVEKKFRESTPFGLGVARDGSLRFPLKWSNDLMTAHHGPYGQTDPEVGDYVGYFSPPINNRLNTGNVGRVVGTSPSGCDIEFLDGHRASHSEGLGILTPDQAQEIRVGGPLETVSTESHKVDEGSLEGALRTRMADVSDQYQALLGATSPLDLESSSLFQNRRVKDGDGRWVRHLCLYTSIAVGTDQFPGPEGVVVTDARDENIIQVEIFKPGHGFCEAVTKDELKDASQPWKSRTVAPSPLASPQPLRTGKVNTALCKRVLTDALGGSGWTRDTRVKAEDRWLRTFTDGDRIAVVVANEKQDAVLEVVELGSMPDAAELKAADGAWRHRALQAES